MGVIPRSRNSPNVSSAKLQSYRPGPASVVWSGGPYRRKLIPNCCVQSKSSRHRP